MPTSNSGTGTANLGAGTANLGSGTAEFWGRPLGITELDIYLLNEGTHSDLWSRFGARVVDGDTVLTAWAPNARSISVVGDLTDWTTGALMHRHRPSGLWSLILPGTHDLARYKFRVTGANGKTYDRADPLARAGQGSPDHASMIRDVLHEWNDGEWLANRAQHQRRDHPLSIYEMHLGSWRRVASDGNRPMSYVEVAEPLIAYLTQMAFTHVELMPIMEHPYEPSWGYQVTGFFQPSSRYGTPDELRGLIDKLHQANIGVILDWVPAHFPADRFGLAEFDGTHLYEHADPREGHHPDWGSLIFNYGRHEVQSFLQSSATWWVDSFHADGLRVDAVASMLYRDFSRKAGEWVPNQFGGRENLEAVAMIKSVNAEVHRRHPSVLMIAEESTAWPGVTRPLDHGGLGFDHKWDLGWMHDTLDYLSRDPIHRRWHHHELTFRQMYSSSEHFVLALSHDEVVHGKGSLLNKMPGDDWQQKANLRLLFAYQHFLPGKKLVFMGGEFGQRDEWSHDRSLDWDLLEFDSHAGISRWVARLNRLHLEQPALHERDDDAGGFAWISCDDAEHSVVALIRRGNDPQDDVLALFNFTATPRRPYRIGAPHGGRWELLTCSDSPEFGGSGYDVPSILETLPVPMHGCGQAVDLVAPPLGMVAYRRMPS